MRTINCLVVRNDLDSRTVAIVEAEVEDSFGDGSSSPDGTILAGTLQRAITQWARETDGGRAAIEASSFDFNVGDLADYVDSGDKVFKSYLKSHGINWLKIKTVDDTTGHNWEYDDKLFDDMEIEAS